ncbi:MAG: tetratricopeptide repeat protein [Candidatus Methylomirabilia bacterium]
MSDPSALLKRARDLFQQGLPEQAEEIVGRLLRDNPRDSTALNFSGYLHFKSGRFDAAIAAYRKLVEQERGVASHYANLGLICFKDQRYPEAQAAFERLLELQPGDAKALRNLGFCFERLDNLEKALDCFTRAGDEEHAAGIRGRLLRPEQAPPARAAAVPPPRAGTGVGGFSAGAPPRPGAVSEPDVSAWLAGASLPRPGTGPEVVRAGAGELVVKVREKVFINPAFCSAHRGIVVFAPASREAEKASSKFGARHGVLARAEGNGELVLSGLGRELHALHLGGRLFVNWGSLVLCGTGITVAFDHRALLKEAFLEAELSGSGQLVLAVRGGPVVLPVVADLPMLVRPESVVAWTEGLSFEAETVPELKKLVGKAEALRYRFEGKGYLVLQSC